MKTLGLFIFSIIAQVIIEMRALWLFENYVISHPVWGDYNTEAVISKWPPCDFLMFSKKKQVKWKKNAVHMCNQMVTSEISRAVSRAVVTD